MRHSNCMGDPAELGIEPKIDYHQFIFLVFYVSKNAKKLINLATTFVAAHLFVSVDEK